MPTPGQPVSVINPDGAFVTFNSSVASVAYAAPISATVGTSSAQLLAANSYSNLVTITSSPTSAGNVYLGFDVAGSTNVAQLGKGFVVLAGGGNVTLSREGPLFMPASTQAIYAISDNGPVALSIQGA